VTRLIPLPDEEEPTLVEKMLLLVMRQIIGGVTKSVGRFIKRALRMLVMALAGVTIAVIGIAFLAVGAVKWFSMLMPSWLAWGIVGVILLLAGVILALTTIIGSRS
jgi:hypothetical protein